MELNELIDRLIQLRDEDGLEDEGCTVEVHGAEVIAVEWDGNTTIEILTDH